MVVDPWSRGSTPLMGSTSKKRKSLMFTSIDDVVEVDVDLVRESEGKRSTRVVKMENSLKFTVRLLFDFCFYFHLFIFEQ